MVSYRQKRVADLIQEELADLLQKEVRDPRLEQVSITGVDVSPDLQHARVYFSIIGDDTLIQETVSAFQKASGYLRKELASRVKLRFVPSLAFRFDDSLNEGDRIERLLRQITTEREPGEESNE